MLEAALVLTLLVGTSLTTVDFGQVMFVHQALVNQARDVARYGSANFSDLNALKNLVVYNMAAPPSPAPPGFLGLTPSMVTVTRSGQNTNDDRLVIEIENYPFTFYSPWLAGSQKMKKIVASYPIESI